MAPKSSKPATKKKYSKGSTSSSSTELILRETAQLFSLDIVDYNNYVRIMIYFISCHPIILPLTEILNPNFHLRILHKVFEHVKIEVEFLEVKITGDRIVSVHKVTFLIAIGFKENPKGFQV